MCYSSDIPLNQIVQLVRQLLIVKALYMTSGLLGTEPTRKPGKGCVCVCV